MCVYAETYDRVQTRYWNEVAEGKVQRIVEVLWLVWGGAAEPTTPWRPLARGAAARLRGEARGCGATSRRPAELLARY